MRSRLLPLFLALLFGLWPLVGFTVSSEDARLPACCRRNGAHHCAMMLAARARMKPARTPQWETPATCDQYPHTPGSSILPTQALRPAEAAMVDVAVARVPFRALTLRPATGAHAPSTSRGPPMRIL